MEGETNQLSEPVTRLVQGKNLAFIATLMKDGSPQITPTWVDLNGKEIVINTAKGRVKEKNLSRDPRIAIAIADQNNPYNMVTIRGTVVDLTAQGADEHIDKLAKKYLGVDEYTFRSPTEKRIIIRVRPDKIFRRLREIIHPAEKLLLSNARLAKAVIHLEAYLQKNGKGWYR